MKVCSTVKLGIDFGMGKAINLALLCDHIYTDFFLLSVVSLKNKLLEVQVTPESMGMQSNISIER